jgi:NADH-quinone oxidoreductase subunit D
LQARARFWGSARLWRAGCGILPQGTFFYYERKFARAKLQKFAMAKTRSPGRRGDRSPEFACATIPSRQRKSLIKLMPFTTREIESPDPATRVAAADAALREQGDDDIGEKMVLNMGPSHPATHGVLRLVLELDGEIITKATPDIGFLHRGDEKIAENMQYNQFVPYTDRLDYLAPLSNNVAYALAVEKLMDWDIPPRGKAIRTICCETSRISSHLLGLGSMALDLGAMSVFLYTFTEREKLYNLFELLTGARFTTSYTRVGGQIRDLPESFIPQLKRFLDDFGTSLDECDRLLTRNKIFVDRTKDIGVITKERAIAYAISGPNLRGSGIEHDLRRKHPYLDYDQYDFDVVIGSAGDCYDRYLVRIDEMRQSARILRQVVDKLPGGPINVSNWKNMTPPKSRVMTKMEELIHHFIVVTEGLDAPPGEVYFGAENPKGELGFYINSRGGGVPYRLKIRAPSFVNLSILPELLPGCLVSDVPAVLGSLDFVMGECDR